MKLNKSQVWNWYNGIKKYKWNDVYSNEEELIFDLLRIDFSKYKPNGYMYLMSFQQQIKNGKTLTEKQMTQLKRNAKSVVFSLYR